MGVAGSLSHSAGVFTLAGSGADIEGASDQFHFAYQPLAGNGSITARVASLQYTHSWAKAGVMIRESLASDSRHAAMLLTPGNGLTFQRRSATAGNSSSTSGGAGAAPYWVRLVRTGNSFAAYRSPDGSTWTLVGTQTITMTGTVYVGLAVTSHSTGDLTTATFDGVVAPPAVRITSPVSGTSSTSPASISIDAAAADPGAGITRVDFYDGAALLGSDTNAPFNYLWSGAGVGTHSVTARSTNSLSVVTSSLPVAVSVAAAGQDPPPAPWLTQDIGGVGVAGTAAFSSGNFAVGGSGTDIEGAADQFRFVYRPLTGNGEIVARVASLQNTDPWAKAGVMIRDTLAANSRHALLAVTAANGLAFQRRNSTGGSSIHVGGGVGAAPYWVRLVRSGTTISSYKSTDGVGWTLVGSATVPLNSTAYVGLALTSHNNAVLGSASFDGVAITPP